MEVSLVDIQSTIRVDQIAARLSAIIRGRTELDVAQFQFMGLEHFAKECGPQWAPRHERICAVAERFIQSRLQPNDIVVRQGEGFAVVFATKIGDAANQTARDIAFELNTHLNNRRDRPNPRVSTFSGPIPVHDLSRMLRAPGGDAPIGLVVQDSISLTRIDWRFQPVWDAESEAVSRYLVVPVVKDTEERVRGYQFEDPKGIPPDFMDIDEASLLVSEQALKRLRSEGKNAVVGVTLHVNSLRQEKSANRLMKVLAGLDLSLARDRMITLAGVDRGFPKMQLGHIVAALRIRVPEVVLSASWDAPDFDMLLAASPTAVGIVYPDRIAIALAQLAGGTLMARFTAGVDAAHAKGMPLYVEGAIDRLQALALREAGADYLASPLIWRPTAAPEGLQLWPRSRLAVA